MGYSASQAKEFINHIAPLMQAEGQKRGYTIISTAIAQAVIEGAAGTSLLARQYHNHFGLKCGRSWKGASVNLKTKEEYKVGTLTTIKDNFRVYADDETGVRGYYDFISATRYANLKRATTPAQYAQYLKADGYATSSTYVNTLVSTVKKYNLEKWDKVVIGETSYPLLKKGSKGDAVKAWQIFLNLNGYQCGNADGIFGVKTETAVKLWQKNHCLVSDGIIGAKTWATIPGMGD